MFAPWRPSTKKGSLGLGEGTRLKMNERAVLAIFSITALIGIGVVGVSRSSHVRANETFQGTAPRIAPAAQLIGLMPDLILAGSTINLAVIVQATSTAPVVFVQGADR